MTDWTPWFMYQLKASADGLEWAFAQIPPARLEQIPNDQDYMGVWPPARHVWHITEYERCLAVPSMYDWLKVHPPSDDDWPDDDAAWAQVLEREPQALIARFRLVRQQQIDLLQRFTAEDWTKPLPTLWGPKPLSMVVTKTLQHTYEHADTLLRMALWWDEIPANDTQ